MKEIKKLENPFGTLASIIAIISVILMFIVDSRNFLGFMCLLPAVLYLTSYLKGETHPKDLFGTTNNLVLSILWFFNTLIWML